MGGIELYIHHLALGLKQKGHEVKIVVPAFATDEKSNYYFEGIEVIRYTAKYPVSRLEFTGIQPNESLQYFKELIQIEKPDIIHFSQLTNSSGVSLQHIKAAKQSGAKVIYTNHLSEFICQRGDLKYMGNLSCDGIVTIEKCTTCLLHKRGINKNFTKAATLIDKVLIKIVGENKFEWQLKPIVFPGFFTRWHIQKIKSVIDQVDAFVSISKWSNDLLKKNGWQKQNCTTITTGLLNAPAEKTSAIKIYDGNRPLKIIFIGRLFRVKGADILIKAIKGIPTHQVEVNFYGPKDNPEYSEYFNHCQHLSEGQKNIIFHEPVPNEQVVQLMVKHDILCVPSRGNEMAPLVIQEAMAAGIPVIGSDLPAIKEWVKDEQNGFIFSVEDAKDLKNKLLRIINEPALLTSFKNRLPAYESFETVINNYEDLYQSLLAGVNE